MPMLTNREIVNWIEQNDFICVIPHVSPDGDCLGSALALTVMLKRMGKSACVSTVDDVPEMYDFMPGQELIFRPDLVPFEPRALLFVDVSTFKRAGDNGILTSRVKGNWALIDHHENTPHFADVCLIDSEAPASGVIVYRLADDLNIEVDELLGTLLYIAISTDTGNFSFVNTTPESFNMAARLMGTGFNLSAINRRVFRMRTLPRIRLLGRAIDAMKFYLDGRIAVTVMDQAMFDECGATHEHAEGIVDCLCDIRGVEVAMSVESRDKGATTKFSMRCNTDFDLTQVAQMFGGGGHKSAAGMNLNIPVDQAGPMAVKAVIEALEA